MALFKGSTGLNGKARILFWKNFIPCHRVEGEITDNKTNNGWNKGKWKKRKHWFSWNVQDAHNYKDIKVLENIFISDNFLWNIIHCTMLSNIHPQLCKRDS